MHEEVSDDDAVKEWTLYLVKEGENPDQQAKQFAKGYWFFGVEDRDPAGHRIYLEAYLRAMTEVDRLNAQLLADGEYLEGRRQRP